MELPEVDGVALQPVQAQLNLLGEVLGTADGGPLVWALAREKAALGGDDRAFVVGSQSFADEPFADGRAVGVRRVDEVHAQFYGALQHLLCRVAVLWFAPDAFAGDTHCAVAEAVDFQFAAQLECL